MPLIFSFPCFVVSPFLSALAGFIPENDLHKAAPNSTKCKFFFHVLIIQFRLLPEELELLDHNGVNCIQFLLTAFRRIQFLQIDSTLFR
jgi:hypothetical protein